MTTEYLLLLGFAGLTFGLGMFLIGMIRNMQAQKAAAKRVPVDESKLAASTSPALVKAASSASSLPQPALAAESSAASQPAVTLDAPPPAEAISPVSALVKSPPLEQVSLPQPSVVQPEGSPRPAAESGLSVALSLAALIATGVVGYRFESHRRQQRGRSA
jgi:hypothetical protein